MISMQTPSITCGLRGLAYMEVEVTGTDKDLHSGLFGGAVANPANVLTRLVAQLVDAEGRVTIPGFYDDVRELHSGRAQGRQQSAVEPRGLQEVALDRRRGGRSGLHDARTYGRASVARRERHLGRLYRGGHQDGDSVEGVGQDFDAAGAESGLPQDQQAVRKIFQIDRSQEREGHGQVAARWHALRRTDRHAGLQGGGEGRGGDFRQETPALLFGRLDSDHQRFRVDSGHQVAADRLRTGRRCDPLAQRELRTRTVLQGRRDHSAGSRASISRSRK